MTKTFSRLLPLLGAGAAVLTLAACGSSSSSTSTTGASDEEKQLAFQDCLRDEGVDATVTRDGFAIRASAAERGSSGGPQGFDSRALETCRKRTGWSPRPPSEAEQAEFRDRALRFAQCMRSHGVDMADPSSDGRMMLRVEPGPTSDAAMRACGRFGGPASTALARP